MGSAARSLPRSSVHSHISGRHMLSRAAGVLSPPQPLCLLQPLSCSIYFLLPRFLDFYSIFALEFSLRITWSLNQHREPLPTHSCPVDQTPGLAASFPHREERCISGGQHLALGARVTQLLPVVTVPRLCLRDTEEMHFEKQQCISIFSNQNKNLTSWILHLDPLGQAEHGGVDECVFSEDDSHKHSWYLVAE